MYGTSVIQQALWKFFVDAGSFHGTQSNAVLIPDLLGGKWFYSSFALANVVCVPLFPIDEARTVPSKAAGRLLKGWHDS